jgi:hypothetical protein
MRCNCPETLHALCSCYVWALRPSSPSAVRAPGPTASTDLANLSGLIDLEDN